VWEKGRKAISPDGREVWIAHSQDGGISIIDVDSKKVVKTLSISTKRSNRLKFTPDGKWVLVSDMDGSMRGDVKRHFSPSTGGGEVLAASSPWTWLVVYRVIPIQHRGCARGYDAVRF
jgi:WD40 repeat protein